MSGMREGVMLMAVECSYTYCSTLHGIFYDLAVAYICAS